jgi:hypothetical protein
LKLSTNEFWIGLPGWMKQSSIPRSAAHASNARLRNSLPLSSESLAGAPRSAIIASRARITATLGSECAAVRPGDSRVQ